MVMVVNGSAPNKDGSRTVLPASQASSPTVHSTRRSATNLAASSGPTRKAPEAWPNWARNLMSGMLGPPFLLM